MQLPKSIRTLADQFSRLPGIGPKSASRIVFYLLSKDKGFIDELSSAVGELKENLEICKICFNYGEENPCEVCTDSKRDQSVICVVEEPLDVIAMERAGFKGLYHVLGGVISPINGYGPEDIRIRELLDRVRANSDKIKEVILATNPSLEGEATAVFISDQLKNLDLEITRLARGLPVGGDLEYADELTLSRSLEGRKEF
jgi:recombination protein RecR